MLVLASLLRLGFVANFMSEPVVIGFKAGIGVVIVLGQVRKILGFHIAGGTFLQNLLATIGHSSCFAGNACGRHLGNRPAHRVRAPGTKGASPIDCRGRQHRRCLRA